MARPMALPRTGCLGKLFSLVLVLVLIVVVAYFVVGNLTPAQLGFGDFEISEGKTVADYGLADVKLKDLLSFVLSLSKDNKSEVVTNAPSEEDEKTTDETMEKILPKDLNGNLDYLKLAEGKVYTTRAMKYCFGDRQLAYAFNQLLQQAVEKGSFFSEDLKALGEMGARIEEITVAKDETGYYLRTVASVAMTEDTKKQLSSIPFLNLKDRIYVTSYNRISVNADGTLQTSPMSVSVNGQSEALSKVILDIAIGEQDGKPADVYLNDTVGSAFADVLRNLGQIGTADADENGYVTGNETIGEAGLKEHEITVLTNTLLP